MTPPDEENFDTRRRLSHPAWQMPASHTRLPSVSYGGQQNTDAHRAKTNFIPGDFPADSKSYLHRLWIIFDGRMPYLNDNGDQQKH